MPEGSTPEPGRESTLVLSPGRLRDLDDGEPTIGLANEFVRCADSIDVETGVVVAHHAASDVPRIVIGRP